MGRQKGAIFSIRESRIENILKRQSNPQVVLKPQDLVVLLKLLVTGKKPRSFAELSAELSMSASEVHGSVGRAREARLLHLATGEMQIIKAALKEFLLHGAKYAFPATVGAPPRGVPTAYAAPPLRDQIVQSDTELPPVWPTADGERRGIAFYPCTLRFLRRLAKMQRCTRPSLYLMRYAEVQPANATWLPNCWRNALHERREPRSLTKARTT